MGAFETQDAFLDSQLLAGAHPERTPLFHGVNDSCSNIKAASRLLNPIRRVGSGVNAYLASVLTNTCSERQVVPRIIL